MCQLVVLDKNTRCHINVYTPAKLGQTTRKRLHKNIILYFHSSKMALVSSWRVVRVRTHKELSGEGTASRN